ncbi:MAG TPA: exodeoxyribonuclease III [Solirubrobacteraceae bacterium]|nr:exodeoxyribonuclease III [Solirubrobacteraceae bacterium]
MLVVTWNVNSLRARLPRVLELLEQHRPDVVCLQETKCGEDQFPDAPLAEAGYAAVHHSAGQWAGVALLARCDLAAGGASPFQEVSLGLPGEAAVEEARWIEATVAGLRVASTYVPNGRSLDSPEFPRKLQFLDAAARRARALAGPAPTLESPSAGGYAGIIIAGDMNIAPTDADVYDPALFSQSTHVTNEERGRLAAIESAGDLLDAYRALHPDTPQFTWWDYRSGHFHKGLGLRIDLALVSRGLAGRLEACGIDRTFRKGTKPSDHAPLLVRLGAAE